MSTAFEVCTTDHVDYPNGHPEARRMQTHENRDFKDTPETAEDVVERLRKRAAEMNKTGGASITAGRPGEQALAEEEVGQFMIRKLPDDKDCLRISIGEPAVVKLGAYLVYRGHTEDVIGLLERALCAIKASKMEMGSETSPLLDGGAVKTITPG